jgi:hypothetical protein
MTHNVRMVCSMVLRGLGRLRERNQCCNLQCILWVEPTTLLFIRRCSAPAVILPTQ